MSLNSLYYQIRPFIPRRFQVTLRQIMVQRKRKQLSDVWPIDPEAGGPPQGWSGWPDHKQFALVLTHDIETAKGQENCQRLVALEKKLELRSSFGFVPGRYIVWPDLRHDLVNNGFEVVVHGLYHDGRYYDSRKIFQTRAQQINQYLREWNSVGFRSPSMMRNLEWLHELDISYDSSSFDTDPFEPQPEGARTLFPFYVNGGNGNEGYVELPYTLPQDFTLFVLLKERDIGIWKRKIDWIAERGGMALLISHPDYMNFDGRKSAQEEYPAYYYEEFLEYVKTKYDGKYWHVLPRDIARYWKENYGNAIIRDISSSRKKKERADNQAQRKLRVAMLSYSFYDIDTRVARYAETLAKRGDHVDAIALGQNGQPAFEKFNGVHIHRIQRRERNERGRISFLSRILKFWVKSSLVINEKHQRDPYDLIHVHSVPDFEVFAAWLPKLRGAKIILDIHDIVPEFYAAKFRGGKGSLLYKMLILVERISCAFADHVIISNHIWGKTLRRSVNRGKCSIYLNYPDPLLFHRRPRTRKDGKFIMMYPGTLNWHQGLDLAIRAFSKISGVVPEAEFHIYGQGESRKDLMDLASRAGLDGRITFHNMLPKEQIAGEMANADLAVVPKRNDFFGGEAFSTKILEFMALGVPVLVSATKIDKYYFNDSIVRFFRPEDEEDLAESMLEMIKEPHRRNSLAENALKFVEEYSWEKRKWEYLNLVDRLVAVPGSCAKGIELNLGWGEEIL